MDLKRVSSFGISDHYLVFASSQGGELGVYKIDLEDDKKEQKLIYLGNRENGKGVYDINSYNYFEGNVYISCHDGLRRYDIETNESITLYDKYVNECFIVDELWIYFSDEQWTLWRTTPDGEVLERVYG